MRTSASQGCSKRRVAYKKLVSVKFSEKGGGTEKGQYGLGYCHKIQSRNSIKYFIMTKQRVCNRLLKILASLYL